jgi:hypothetical protein
VEGARIATPRYREQLGEAIAQAVTAYHKAVNFESSGPALVSNAGKLPPHARAITDSLGESPPVPAKAAQTPSAAIEVSD